jgi:septal ring factor EnvC (AmiA/AmiB activator)
MIKILLYGLLLAILLVGIFLVSRLLIESLPSINSNLKLSNKENNPSNIFSAILSFTTILVLCATLYLQQRQHREVLEQQKNQYEAQIEITRKEHSFEYIDALFEKFEKNLVNNSDRIENVNQSIIKVCQDYLSVQKAIENGDEMAQESHSNEFWTEAEVEADIESLYHLISRYEFLEEEIKMQENLSDEIKKVYLEN